MFCSKCGTENKDDAVFCGECGTTLKSQSPTSISGDPGIQVIIPYKNAKALIAYYCGVFSLIPCFPIGLIGLVLGILGLKYAKEHPEAKGKIHAWVGIILGGLFGILYTVGTIVAVIGMMKR